jgi:hypothetical protein
MSRTTSAAVIGILQGDYDTINNPSLQPFIDSASIMVDRVVAVAKTKASPVSLLINEQEVIERWLAAHFYCVSDQPYAAKTTAGASANFQGRTDIGLEGTKYGQMAIRLDYSGILNAIDKRLFSQMAWLGKPAGEQTPYRQRN